MSSSKYQGILSIAGGIFTMLTIGQSLPFASLSYYFTFENNPKVFPCQSLLYFAIILFMSNMANLFSMNIAQITGTRLISLLGIILIGSGYFVLYFKIELYFHYISMALIGLGIGLQFNPILHNIWSFYPESKGLVSLSLLILYGLSSVLFIGFIEYMFSSFNLTGEIETTHADKETMISSYLVIVVIMTISLGFIGFLMTPNYKKDDTHKAEKLLLKEKSINDDNLSQSNYKEMEYSKEEIIHDPPCFTCRIIFNSVRFWLIVFMSLLSFIFCFTFTHLLRFIGIYNGFNSKMIVVGLILYPSVLTISRIIIAFLYEWIGFKLLFSLILLCQIFISAFIPYINNEYVYLGFTALSGFCYAGNSTLISPFIYKIYGGEYSFDLSGIINFISSLSVFVLPIISFIFGKTYDIQLLIKYVFFGCIGSSGLALLLCLFMSDATFDYSHMKGTLAHNLKQENTIDKEMNHQFIDVKSEIES